MNLSDEINTVPLVPSDSITSPSFITPEPMAAIALSAPPQISFAFFKLYSGFRFEIISKLSHSFGSHDSLIWHKSKIYFE